MKKTFQSLVLYKTRVATANRLNSVSTFIGLKMLNASNPYWVVENGQSNCTWPVMSPINECEINAKK